MKKLTLILTFLSMLTYVGYAQNIFVPGGTVGSSGPTPPSTNVGIGTPAPVDLFHVLGGDIFFEDNNFRTGGPSNLLMGAQHSGALGEDNDIQGGHTNFTIGLSNKIFNSDNSLGLGKSNAISNGVATLALGADNFVDGGHSVAIGSFLNSSGGGNITMGKDVVNPIPSSFMLGFNSNLPTLFVGPSSGPGTTGEVGIGTSTPQAKLDVEGSIRSSDLVGGGNICADLDGNLVLSGPCGGDDLGNHIANMPLDMQCNPVMNTGDIIFCNSMVVDQNSPGEIVFQGGAVGIGINPNLIAPNPPAFPNTPMFAVAGDMWANGTWYNSDSRYKSDINQLPNALEKVMQINGYSYEYQRNKFPEMNFSQGVTNGFIAQELAEVYPELVRQKGDGYYSVNYIAIIPVLTEAIKEQQTIIENQMTETEFLKSEIEELKSAVQSICNNGCGNLKASTNGSDIQSIPSYWNEVKLEQNSPNPFNSVTTIRYSLPIQVKEASLLIYNLQGKQIKKINITETGEGSIEIEAGTLSGGMYLYGLLVDGNASTTLKMILTD